MTCHHVSDTLNMYMWPVSDTWNMYMWVYQIHGICICGLYQIHESRLPPVPCTSIQQHGRIKYQTKSQFHFKPKLYEVTALRPCRYGYHGLKAVTSYNFGLKWNCDYVWYLIRPCCWIDVHGTGTKTLTVLMICGPYQIHEICICGLYLIHSKYSYKPGQM